MAAMAQPKKTLYQILGVPRDASTEKIGLAYEMRSSELDHATPPDPSGVALARDAFQILSNPERRAAYDAALISAAEKAAAAQQATPDLELEAGDDDDDAKRKKRLMMMVGGMALVFALLFLVFRPKAPAPPVPVPVAEAPKPKPAPPKLRTGSEILADVSSSSGQLLSFEMSGAAVPIGIAVATEPRTMITTCHGIPAGSKLVVKVGATQHAAELTITDEELDLCRLSLADFNTPPHKVATEEPQAGAKVFVVGANAKGEFAATEGTVKAIRRTPLGNVLELSVPIAATGSGGPVFNEQGQLVGIATTPHKLGAGDIALPSTWLAQMRSRTQPAK